MQEKRAQNLSGFIHGMTKDYHKNLDEKYSSHRNGYFKTIYEKLIDCYNLHMTPLAQANLNSDSMLAYYSCYKKTLRAAKDVNKKLKGQSLVLQIKLKQCVQSKTNMTRSTFDFEDGKDKCLDGYEQETQKLFMDLFYQDALAEQNSVQNHDGKGKK